MQEDRHAISFGAPARTCGWMLGDAGPVITKKSGACLGKGGAHGPRAPSSRGTAAACRPSLDSRHGAGMFALAEHEPEGPHTRGQSARIAPSESLSTSLWCACASRTGCRGHIRSGLAPSPSTRARTLRCRCCGRDCRGWTSPSSREWICRPRTQRGRAAASRPRRWQQGACSATPWWRGCDGEGGRPVPCAAACRPSAQASGL